MGERPKNRDALLASGSGEIPIKRGKRNAAVEGKRQIGSFIGAQTMVGRQKQYITISADACIIKGSEQEQCKIVRLGRTKQEHQSSRKAASALSKNSVLGSQF